MNVKTELSRIDKIDKLRQIMKSRQGLLLTSDLANFNIPRTYLSIMGKNGEIEHLRNLGFPIVSTSDKAGYKLDTDPKNIEEMIREWESRIVHLQHRVDAARHYRETFLRIFPHK